MSPYAARPPMGQRDSAARVKRLFSAAAFQLQIDRVRAGIHRHWNEPILTAVRFRDQFRDVGTIRCLVCRRDPYVVLPNESAGFRGIELQLVVAILVGFRRRRSPLRLRFKRNERVRNRLAVQRNLSRNPAQFRTEAKNNRGHRLFVDAVSRSSGKRTIRLDQRSARVSRPRRNHRPKVSFRLGSLALSACLVPHRSPPDHLQHNDADCT